jgi:glyoxylase-like metal-dependent hydrolase (beta-lactamase superfamily II)
MEIVPGVHLVPHTRGANVYLVDGPTLALVDTGLRHNAEAILGYIASLGHQPQDLTRIILTHCHPDHSGSTAELQAKTGAELLVHAGDVEPDGRHLRPAFEGPGGPLLALATRFMRRQEVRVREPLGDGQVLPVLEGLQVVHTPGHTPGSICLYSAARRLVFVGDMVINNRTRLSRPLPAPGSDQAVYEASLRRLAVLDFEVCLFGHGPAILKGGTRLLQEVAQRPPAPSVAVTIARNLRTLLKFGLRLPKQRRD